MKPKKIHDSTSSNHGTPATGKLVDRPPKRVAPTEPSAAPVAKRKPAPANLFITKKPPASNAGNGIKIGDKKESVKQRLMREMVFSVFQNVPFLMRIASA